MKFAINYSPQAEALLRSGQIELDLFKCPDWEDLVAKAQNLRSVYIHFPFIIGQNKIAQLDLVNIEKWLARTNTRYINTHVAPTTFQFPAETPPEAIVETVINEIMILVREFGKDCVIIENVPYPDPAFLPGLLPTAIDPAFLHALIAATGCGFLLDISHAVLTCENTGRNIYDYLTALPVQHLRELHITGIGVDQDGGRTDHLPLTPDDKIRLEWAVEQIKTGVWARPDILAFEYGGIGPIFEWRSDAGVIAEQTPYLYKLCQSMRTESMSKI